MKKQFHYVVAKPWYEDEPDSLCIYTYRSQVQKGTIKDAKEFLEYVKAKSQFADKYAIYKVKYKKVE